MTISLYSCTRLLHFRSLLRKLFVIPLEGDFERVHPTNQTALIFDLTARKVFGNRNVLEKRRVYLSKHTGLQLWKHLNKYLNNRASQCKATRPLLTMVPVCILSTIFSNIGGK